MKILVTGGAGYLGSVVVRDLLRHGHRVRVLDDLRYGGAAIIGLYQEEGFEFVRGDLRSEDAVREALRAVQAVVHLAAIVGDPACARQPEPAREINLDGSLRLYETARRHDVQRFVFASTCSNYGRMPDPSEYVTEASELRPVSLYAETKVAVEQALLADRRDDRPAVTVLRFATLYGVSPRMRFDLTVNEFAMELLLHRHLVIYGGQFWRPYLHIRDAARAIRMVLDRPLEAGDRQIYNVGDTRENYQKRTLAELARAEVGGDAELVSEYRDEDPRDYRVSFDKIHRELGFEITRRVPDGVREVIHAIDQRVITDVANPCYRN